MKPDVAKAVAELKEGLPQHEVHVREDSDGGAFVLVEGMEIGDGFAPNISWIGFQITFAYPDADVYPHFLDPQVRYVGQGAAPNQHAEGNLPTAMTRGAMLPGFDRPAIQVSRRSNHRCVATDSALQKLLRIVAFLRSR
jgi:hypothetical protein